VHQVGFSLHYYIEMYGQQKVSKKIQFFNKVQQNSVINIQCVSSSRMYTFYSPHNNILIHDHSTKDYQVITTKDYQVITTKDYQIITTKDYQVITTKDYQVITTKLPVSCPKHAAIILQQYFSFTDTSNSRPPIIIIQ